jgi:glutaredoxin
MAKVKLHRCPFTFVHNDLDHCWKVQKALEDQGIEYDIVKEPALPRSRRKDVIRMSGQKMLPVVEFEDGSAYRAESKDMAAEINAGKLFEHAGAGSSPAPASAP